MKLNADQCHLLVLGQRCDDPVTVRIGHAEIALKRSYLEFKLIADFPSIITFPNCAKRRAINCMHSLAYPHTWMFVFCYVFNLF